MEDIPEYSQFQQPARQRFLERPQVKIVRPSNRRKFLAGLLGGAAILGIGWTGGGQLIQNLRVTLNTKDYPFNIWDDLVSDSFSPDLNLMAMVKVGEEDGPNAKLFIWNYQQQHMTTLLTGPGHGLPACIWSPDSRYFLYQTSDFDGDATLDMWDMQTQEQIHTYWGDDYEGFSKIHWSPDGSQVALLSNNTFMLMDARQLAPLFTFKAPAATVAFAWSPDGRKIAFLLDDSDANIWSTQIWDLRTRKMEREVIFSHPSEIISQTALSWSPDGTYIAALAREQLRIIRVADTLTSYSLDAPGNSTKFAWSPDGRYLAVSTWDLRSDFWSSAQSTFNVWDIIERKVVRSYDRSTTDNPGALAWSRDSKRIIVIGSLYRQENWDWP